MHGHTIVYGEPRSVASEALKCYAGEYIPLYSDMLSHECLGVYGAYHNRSRHWGGRFLLSLIGPTLFKEKST